MSQDIIQILRGLYPGLDLDPLLKVAGGRQWYVPSLRRLTMAEKKEAIRRDQCRDRFIVSRRYHVSISTVYNVWNEMAG